LCTLNSIVLTYFVCGEGKTFFNSHECANTVLYGHLWGLNFSASYLLVDFVFLIIYRIYESPLEKQNLIHHILSFGVMWMTEATNQYPLVLAVVLLFMEGSTPFACGRWVLKTHGVTEGNLV